METTEPIKFHKKITVGREVITPGLLLSLGLPLTRIIRHMVASGADEATIRGVVDEAVRLGIKQTAVIAAPERRSV